MWYLSLTVLNPSCTHIYIHQYVTGYITTGSNNSIESQPSVKKFAWKSLEILTQRWHRKTSFFPSQEQDIPLREDLERNTERTLWSNFMGQCLFRKKSWKGKELVSLWSSLYWAIGSAHIRIQIYLLRREKKPRERFYSWWDQGRRDMSAIFDIKHNHWELKSRFISVCQRGNSRAGKH